MTDARAAFERLLIATQTLAHVADRDIVRRALEQLAPEPSEAEMAWEDAHNAYFKFGGVPGPLPNKAATAVIQAYGNKQRAEERERAARIVKDCVGDYAANQNLVAAIRDGCKP